ncbi:Protein of unknown function [Pyronema omphalodes CBS 100304]|uniref:Uncharacterized protein n=1 Tax=Pyronema omphalodes (strain CBS 100304) TaxID=1076935 RepID=U4LT63_PYROM|nr:Protein of unknown function [Pyronema omphalodes CBS 100304]
MTCSPVQLHSHVVPLCRALSTTTGKVSPAAAQLGCISTCRNAVGYVTCRNLRPTEASPLNCVPF